MKIYVAGPMRGIPELNFPMFHAAAAKLRAEGHHVFNPAERDIKVHGTDISKGNETGDEALAAAMHGFNLREVLKDDLEFICLHADAVGLLPGWETSKGAVAEASTARAWAPGVQSGCAGMKPTITRTVAESDVLAWWNAGWQFIGIAPGEDAGCVMRWDSDSAPVQPLRDDEPAVVAGAVAALEGRAG